MESIDSVRGVTAACRSLKNLYLKDLVIHIIAIFDDGGFLLLLNRRVLKFHQY